MELEHGESVKGRTASKEVRRQQLIDATIDSIAVRGFSGTTIAQVSKGAKLSYGIVNYHFTNKETLYAETLEYLTQEHYQQWSKAMEDAGDEPHKKLSAIIQVDFKSDICSPKKLSVWFAFWGQAIQRPAYLKMHDELDRKRDTTITQLCLQIAQSEKYDNVDCKAIARKLIALIDGFWLGILLYPELTNSQQSCEDCLSFLSDAFPNHFLTK